MAQIKFSTGEVFSFDGEISVYEAAASLEIISREVIACKVNGTLTELARRLYLSEPYLSGLIVRLFGKSFKALLVDERMRRATTLITDSSMPISEIISSVGYENSSYFHREFKKRYGKSPLAVRKENE